MSLCRSVARHRLSIPRLSSEVVPGVQQYNASVILSVPRSRKFELDFIRVEYAAPLLSSADFFVTCARYRVILTTNHLNLKIRLMTSKLNAFNRLVLVGAIMALATLSAYAQQSFGGTPLAIDAKTSLRSSDLEKHMVSIAFNPADLELRDAWSAPRDGRPLSVGQLVPYQADFAQDAVLVRSEAGTEVYRMIIQLEGTPVGIGLYYDDFYIPEGGRLFIYTPGGHQVLGAYTHDTHSEHGGFATEPLAGRELILDYEAPEGVGLPSIQIRSVGYFYRPVLRAAYGQEYIESFQRNEDNSDPGLRRFCQINANCPEGDNYQDEKASSVAILISNTTDGIVGMCSGNLINNVEGDFTPFIITAAHCSGLKKTFEPSRRDLETWVFGFHYEKPRCSSGDYATPMLRSMVGASMKAFLPIDGYSDGLLLQLIKPIPADYRVFYSGWDAADQDWQKGAGLHHPAGDALKVSTFDGGVKIGSWNGKQPGGDKDHLNFKFQKGNTEGGSSGSPLFNEAGRQIGTLSGGNGGICPKDGSYGRFYSHFAKYEKEGDSFNMKHWLDPKKTGKTQVDGIWKENYQPLRVVKALSGSIVPDNRNKVALSWDAVPAHPQGYKISYNLYRNDDLIKTLTETKYEDTVDATLTEPGRINYKVEACYEIDGKKVTTPAAFRAVYTGELMSEVYADVKAASTGMEIKWSMPYNTQIVSKISNRDNIKKRLLKAGNEYSFKDVIRNVYLYDVYRLGRSPFAGQKLYIHQINMIPAYDTPVTASGATDYRNAIRFFARQRAYGDNNRMQTTTMVVPQGAAAKKEWLSVRLLKPVEINDEYNLEVGFYWSKDNSNARIYIDPDSRDEYIGQDGCLLGLESTDNPSRIFESYGHYSKERMGYQAIELVISNNPNKQDGTTSRAFTRGKLPVAFPEVKKYVIYRDDVKVHETADANTYTWTDTQGKSDNKYRIEVIYDYPNELRPVEQITQVAPELYPVHFAETLQLSNPDEVLRVQLFNLQGVAVAEFSGAELAGMLDVSRLPEGAYVAVVTTAEGTTTQKLVK